MAAPCESFSGENGNRKAEIPDFYDHPKFKEMLEFGFSDVAQLRLAFHVYLDLVENKCWWNVRALGCVSLQMALVCGHPSQRENEECVLAIHGDNTHTMDNIQQITTDIADILPHVKGVLFGLVDVDSSISYYRISEGMVPPAPPEEIEAKLARQKRQADRKKKRFTKFRVDARGSKKDTVTRRVNDGDGEKEKGDCIVKNRNNSDARQIKGKEGDEGWRTDVETKPETRTELGISIAQERSQCIGTNEAQGIKISNSGNDVLKNRSESEGITDCEHVDILPGDCNDGDIEEEGQAVDMDTSVEEVDFRNNGSHLQNPEDIEEGGEEEEFADEL